MTEPTRASARLTPKAAARQHRKAVRQEVRSAAQPEARTQGQFLANEPFRNNGRLGDAEGLATEAKNDAANVHDRPPHRRVAQSHANRKDGLTKGDETIKYDSHHANAELWGTQSRLSPGKVHETPKHDLPCRRNSHQRTAKPAQRPAEHMPN
jgi:hypothetical protein